jgi:hypothetical protein
MLDGRTWTCLEVSRDGDFDTSVGICVRPASRPFVPDRKLPHSLCRNAESFRGGAVCEPGVGHPQNGCRTVVGQVFMRRSMCVTSHLHNAFEPRKAGNWPRGTDLRRVWPSILVTRACGELRPLRAPTIRDVMCGLRTTMRRTGNLTGPMRASRGGGERTGSWSRAPSQGRRERRAGQSSVHRLPGDRFPLLTTP